MAESKRPPAGKRPKKNPPAMMSPPMKVYPDKVCFVWCIYADGLPQNPQNQLSVISFNTMCLHPITCRKIRRWKRMMMMILVTMDRFQIKK